jgi:lysozyme
MDREERKERKKRKKKGPESVTASSLLGKIGIGRGQQEIVTALKKIHAGDRALLRKISDGQKLSHEESEELRQEMEKVNENLELLRKTFMAASPAPAAPASDEPAKVVIVGADGRPVEAPKPAPELPAPEPIPVEDLKLTFKEASELVRKQIKENDLSRDQVRFLLEKLVEIGDANEVEAPAFDELRSIVGEKTNILGKDDETLDKILSEVRDQTEEDTTNLNLGQIKDQLEQANFINDRLADDAEERSKKDRLAKLKEDKRKSEFLANAQDGLAELLGVPSLQDLKKIGNLAKENSEFLKSLPGAGLLAKVAGPAAAALLGVAIGTAIGEMVIDPIFDFFGKKRKEDTEKQLARQRERSSNLGSDSEEAVDQSRTNLALIEKAAASGVFGEERKSLNVDQQMAALESYNKSLKAGKTQDEAFAAVFKHLNQKDLGKAHKEGGSGAMSREKERQKSDTGFQDRLKAFKQSNSADFSAAAALPGTAAGFRSEVTSGLQVAAPSSDPGAAQPRTTTATAEGLAGKMGWRTPSGTETGDLTLDLLKSMESFEPYTKPDPVGKPTIGYGHYLQTPEEVAKYEGKTLTEAEATQLLRKDVEEHQKPWISQIKVPVSQEQIAAMTLAAFNLGAYHKSIKKMVDLTNEGKTEEAAAVLLHEDLTTAKDDRTGQRVQLPGLVKRRGLESGLFLAGAQGLAAQASGISEPAPAALATAEAVAAKAPPQPVQPEAPAPQLQTPKVTEKTGLSADSRLAFSTGLVEGAAGTEAGNAIESMYATAGIMPVVAEDGSVDLIQNNRRLGNIATDGSVSVPTQGMDEATAGALRDAFKDPIMGEKIISALVKSAGRAGETKAKAEVPETKAPAAANRAAAAAVPQPAPAVSRAPTVVPSGGGGNSGKKTGINEISLAVIKNGMLDGI